MPLSLVFESTSVLSEIIALHEAGRVPLSCFPPRKIIPILVMVLHEAGRVPLIPLDAKSSCVSVMRQLNKEGRVPFDPRLRRNPILRSPVKAHKEERVDPLSELRLSTFNPITVVPLQVTPDQEQ